jgi:hypothetical protein
MKTNKIFLSALALSVGIMAFNSCSSSDDDNNNLPPIGGFNNSNEVGEADRVAYWPLDGDGVEDESGTAPNGSSGVTWAAGIKGQGATLANGFLKYPSIASMATGLTNFSVSGWFKVMNNADGSASPSVFFSLARPAEWAGNINFMAETGWQPSTSDSLTVKGLLVSNNALGFQDSRNTVKATPEDIALGHVAFPNKVAGTWVHGVITWDNETRLYKVYTNGTKISNPVWELRGADDSPDFSLSPGAFPVLGAFGTFADGTTTDVWNRGMTGQLDEVRVWKRALTQAEIGSLYQLELAGR